MEVDRVSVSLKYSQVLASGNTKTVEVEASGTVSPKETWQQAQAYLYAELEKQVMEVFKLPEAKLEAARIQPTSPPPMRDPNDPEGIFQQRPPAKAWEPGPMPPESWLDESGARAAIEGPAAGPAGRCRLPNENPAGGPLHHWCVRHAAQFHQHTKNGASWWSHKVDGTEEWCREE